MRRCPRSPQLQRAHCVLPSGSRPALAEGKRGSCRGIDDKYRKFHVRLERAGQLLRDTIAAINVRRGANIDAVRPRPLALAHTSPPPAFAHNWP